MLPRLQRLKALFVLVLLIGCAGRADAQGHIDQSTLMETGEKTPEISTAELRAIIRERRAVVIDTRPFREYAMGHIPGALDAAPKPGVSMSLYISDVEEVGRIVQENPDTPIVLYCDGPFCDKSKQLADGLLAEGYTHVKRYQLGMPVWLALGNPAQIELAGVALILANDHTALFIDAREPEEFNQKTLPGARNLPRSRLIAEKNNGEDAETNGEERLLAEDHRTRVIVFGDNEEQAGATAEALARKGFSNVSFFAGTFQELLVAAAADQHK
jgi:rhodanese-related sulfurtransferase